MVFVKEYAFLNCPVSTLPEAVYDCIYYRQILLKFNPVFCYLQVVTRVFVHVRHDVF